MNTISESLPLPASEFQFSATSNADELVKREVGYLPQRKGDSNRRQNYGKHLERPNRYNGVLRNGSNGSLEEPLSPDRGECSFGLSPNGGRGLDYDPKSILRSGASCRERV